MTSNIGSKRIDDIQRGERLKEVIENIGYTQSSLAVASGESQPNISNYLAGKSPIPSSLLAFLYTTNNVNANYILTGIGNITISDKTNPDLIKENSELKRDYQKLNDSIVSQVAELQKIVYAADKSKKIVK